MLTVFPALLSYSFFAPLLLRIATALMFAFAAWKFWNMRTAFANTSFPFIGTPGIPVVLVAVGLNGAVALMLAIGLYTQVAALLGIVLACIHAALGDRPGISSALSGGTYLLLAAICASLVITGAGGYAFDLPL